MAAISALVPGNSSAIPAEGEDLAADYAHPGLILGRHPPALLRPELRRPGMLTAAEPKRLRQGRRARIAGLVTGHQRPASAAGVMFPTLKDETGSSNVIVRKALIEHHRRPLLAARLLTRIVRAK